MATAHVATRLACVTPMRKLVERRISRRYDLALTLAIFPFSGRMIPQEQVDLPRGKSRDISTDGIYFTTKEALAPGSELAFALILPAELTHGKEVFVCAKGRVVRNEKKNENGFEHNGVAAIIEGYEIIKDDPLYREYFGADTKSAWPPSSPSL